MEVVAYLHYKRVVHCDLKPENFVYKHKGSDELKLIDFGLSQRLPEDGRPLTKMNGPLHYVAPEVIAQAYDEKADVWSTGIILYTMLCGVMPWRGSNARVIQRIRAGEPSFDALAWPTLSAPA